MFCLLSADGIPLLEGRNLSYTIIAPNHMLLNFVFGFSVAAGRCGIFFADSRKIEERPLLVTAVSMYTATVESEGGELFVLQKG